MALIEWAMRYDWFHDWVITIGQTIFDLVRLRAVAYEAGDEWLDRIAYSRDTLTLSRTDLG